MTDISERKRREEQERLQAELDKLDGQDRLRGERDDTERRLDRPADQQRLQVEVDRILAESGWDAKKTPPTDIRERQRLEAQESLQNEFDKAGEGRRPDRVRETADARLDRAADQERVQAEIDRILASPEPNASGLEQAKQRIERLDRIAERDATRHLPDFDPEKVRKMDDFEIETDPGGFIRRHEGGLDPETERKIRESVRELEKKERR